MKKLHIAQLATPWERVPPTKYGGTELIASLLTEELIRRGHEVTLFATGDSKTRGTLKSVYPKALYRAGVPWTNSSWPLLHVQECMERASEFDIIHNHFHYFGLTMGASVQTPVITTYHGDFETAEKDAGKKAILKKNKHMPFVSISNDQRKHTTVGLNFVRTVYNAIDIAQYQFGPTHGNYLVWLGRITQKKGVIEAIQVAKKFGMKLLIAAKIDVVDEEFYTKDVKPLLSKKHAEYVGEIGLREKAKLLKGAYALVNPIKWNEPFGLVMVEAQACGTPVVAFPNGAAPELIKNRKTGYFAHTVDGLVAGLKQVPRIDRAACRKNVEDHFTVKHMVDGYEATYLSVLKTKK
ncbi:MAG: glycosyl transferase [Candidatus Kerfeldbacteria bacterium CG08_land_8_20_14_0_20_42_7]|uniref:Glycosyl transferase n=1 Tax=Candidatus Kerfeldbacteria bacterium CG08_land_8_20_14_0_20_42_7 TaxID=2014245 RepID=A0A2H0YW24_9BACT|nr:MAG: glycosyl transferase [Candidatus Kerfeldbacteria bacterium CG08_land_8_20_14_0_20_42_7]